MNVGEKMEPLPRQLTEDAQARSEKAGLVTVGGVLGALAASSCCVIPLALFSLGVSGAWMAQLRVLAPYQPIFLAVAVGFLGYGFWLIYRKPRGCGEAAACARPVPNKFVKAALWLSTGLVAISIAWPWLLPIIYG